MPERSEEKMSRVILRFSRNELFAHLAGAYSGSISLEDPVSVEWDEGAQQLVMTFFEAQVSRSNGGNGGNGHPGPARVVPGTESPGVKAEVLMIMGGGVPMSDTEITEQSPSRYSEGAIRRARKQLVDEGRVKCCGRDPTKDGRGNPKLWVLVQGMDESPISFGQDG